MHIRDDDLTDPRVRDLLSHHAATARAETAQGSAHALDVTGLTAPDMRVWTIWAEGALIGTAALRRLDAAHGEIKAMHVREAARGRGAGAALLRHIVAHARAQGMTRLSLETGAWPYFIAARTLYARHGFRECDPFGDYRADPNSVFMTRDLITA